MADDWDTSESAPPEAKPGGGSAVAAVSPVVYLSAAVVSMSLAIVMAVRGGYGASVVGYLFASPITFSLVALFRRAGTERLFSDGVATPRGQTLLGYVLLGLGFVGSVVFAWMIARHFA